jgi:NIMA-interacting peptidyl-prolyl cis-trans isomerase 1
METGPKKVTCSHILQKHSQSRNPVDSYRNKKITRSPEEALKNIESIRNDYVNGKNFEELAEQYSECRSAGNKGSLGEFGRGEMQKAFEDVAFSLKVGECSDPVSTDSGIHIILRTA